MSADKDYLTTQSYKDRGYLNRLGAEKFTPTTIEDILEEDVSPAR